MKSSHRQKLMPKIFVYAFFWVFMLSDCGNSKPQNRSTNNGVPVKELDSSLQNRTASFLSASSLLSPMSSLKGSGLTTHRNALQASHVSKKRRSALPLENESSAGVDSQTSSDDADLESQEHKKHRQHSLSIRSKKKAHSTVSSDKDSAGSVLAENALPYPHSKIYREQEDEDLANYIYYIINDFVDEREEKVYGHNGETAVDDDGGGGGVTNFNSQHHRDLHLEYPSSPVNSRANLVRKRRQKSSPLDHRRHRGDDAHRRRQRRRNRRHRHLHTTDNTLAEAEPRASPEKFQSRHPEGFFLKSDSPSYIITSASELKKDWCRTIPLPQKVVEKNCRTKVVMNNFCYGQCNSFFIPHPGRRGSQAAFQSCAFCKPHRLKWTNVTLHCPGQNPPKREKRIMLVESCRCITEVLQ